MNIVSDLANDGQPLPAPVADHPMLADIKSGNFDGVYLPAGSDTTKAKELIPDWDTAMKLGLDVYDPESEDIELVIFNPKKIKPEVVKKADFEGTLKDVLRSADTYFTPGAATASEVAPDSKGEGEGTGRSTIMPTEGSTPDAALTKQRAKNSTNTLEPSKRAIPGAGVILNDLVKRVI